MASIKTATPGIAGCLTPGGWSYLPHLGRSVTGTEKLLFQGIPVDRLQLGQESEVQVSDLAGNAMSLSVVSSAILAALCVKQFARERKRILITFSRSQKSRSMLAEYIERSMKTLLAKIGTHSKK